ncbi:MAG TPA: pyrimidine dimer DNA glycosylase/endonuclease V [Terriglobales bacterium]|nr:pyrimidine dimer DNA glycosylase/endonuclease V [Terriglobales bacterium]
MVPPRRMCRKHLLGEHVEIHMAVASLRLGRLLDGFLEKGLLELHNLRARHDALVEEMRRRGYRHRSPLGRVPRRRGGRINRRHAAQELARRCPDCFRS